MDNGKRLLLGQLPRPRPRRHPPHWSRGSDSLLLPIPSELLRSPRHTPPPPHQGRPRLRLDGSCWALGCAPRHRESNSGLDGQRLLRRRSGCQRFGAEDDLANAKGVKTQEASSRRRALQLRTKRASQGGGYASPELVSVAQHGDGCGWCYVDFLNEAGSFVIATANCALNSPAIQNSSIYRYSKCRTTIHTFYSLFFYWQEPKSCLPDRDCSG